MKRIVISAILALSFTVSARAGYDFEVDGIYYRIISLSEMTCAVVDSGENDTKSWEAFVQPEGEDYSGDIIIPDEVSFKGRNLKVTRIAQGAFFGCRSINSLVIGANVKEIGKYATGVCDIDFVEIKCGNLTLAVDTYGLTGKEIIVGRSIVYNELYASFHSIWFDDSVREIPACPSSFPEYRFSYRWEHYYKEHWDDPVFQTQTIWEKIDDPEVWRLVVGSNASSVGDMSKLISADGASITVNAVNPPKAVAFSNKAYVNSVLYVPDESVENYRNAPVWKNFWEILPLSETIIQVDSLNTPNKILTAEVNEVLTSQVQDIVGQESAGKALQASNLYVYAYNSNGKNTDRGGRAVGMVANFSLVANAIADYGPVMVYVVLIDPDGRVLTNGASTAFTTGGESLTATASRSIDYGGSQVDVSVYLKDLGEFIKGIYTVNVYTSAGLLGSSQIMLR